MKTLNKKQAIHPRPCRCYGRGTLAEAIEHPREIKSVVMKTKSNNREISRTLSVEQRLDKATEVPRKGSKQERDGVIQDPLKEGYRNPTGFRRWVKVAQSGDL